MGADVVVGDKETEGEPKYKKMRDCGNIRPVPEARNWMRIENDVTVSSEETSGAAYEERREKGGVRGRTDRRQAGWDSGWGAGQMPTSPDHPYSSLR